MGSKIYMIRNFIHRINVKCGHLIFRIMEKNTFFMLGKSTYMNGPYRIDGGKFIALGDNTIFQRGCWLYVHIPPGEQSSPLCMKPKLSVGKGCYIGYNNHFSATNNVHIGERVMTANNVYISDNIHTYTDITIPIMDQKVSYKSPVSIGDGSWIGENACIIGATIGSNCVIGANSVVTKDIPNYCVAIGAPARIIRQYDEALNMWKNIK